MSLSQSFQQKLLQKLSPQQIQLMKLLQVPTANLEERIKEELKLGKSHENAVNDGYRRSLSNGKGIVYINGKACPVVGRVCMDMIMVDVTHKKVKEGDRVELIGKQYCIEKLADAMETIPYEVMTGISRRVNRVYLEE